MTMSGFPSLSDVQACSLDFLTQAQLLTTVFYNCKIKVSIIDVLELLVWNIKHSKILKVCFQKGFGTDKLNLMQMKCILHLNHAKLTSISFLNKKGSWLNFL